MPNTIYPQKYGATGTIDDDVRKGRTAQITFTQVPYSDWENAVQLWQSHPEYSYLKCMHRKRVPVGKANSKGKYDWCHVVADYETPKTGENPDENEELPYTINIEGSGEILQVEGSFEDGSSNVLTYQPALHCPQSAIRVDLKVRNLPIGLLDSCKGKVNSDNVYFKLNKRGSRYNCGAGTLLLDSFSSQTIQDENGKQIWNLSIAFLHRPNKWNYVPKINGAAIEWVATTPAIYETTAFAPIMKIS